MNKGCHHHHVSTQKAVRQRHSPCYIRQERPLLALIGSVLSCCRLPRRTVNPLHHLNKESHELSKLTGGILNIQTVLTVVCIVTRGTERNWCRSLQHTQNINTKLYCQSPLNQPNHVRRIITINNIINHYYTLSWTT